MATTGIIWFNYLSASIMMAITLWIGVAVYRRDRDRELSRVFFVWMLLNALGAGFFFAANYYLDIYSTTRALTDLDRQYLFSILTRVLAAVEPCLILHFSFVFLRFGPFGRRSRRARVILYLPFLVLLGTIAASEVVGWRPYAFESAVKSAYYSIVEIAHYYTILMYALLLVPIVLLVRRCAGAGTEVERNRSLYVLCGVLLVFVLQLLFIVTTGLAMAGHAGLVRPLSDYLTSWQVFVVPLSALLFVYAILRFGLLDIKILVRKSVMYSFFSVGMVVIFVTIGELFENLLQATVLGATFTSQVIAALVILALFKPIERYSKRLAERLVPPELESVAERSLKLDAFQSALATAYSDGVVTDKERLILDQMGAALGITDRERHAFERELRAAVEHADAPRTVGPVVDAGPCADGIIGDDE